MQVAQVETSLTPRGSIENGLQLKKYCDMNGGRDAMKLIMMLVENTAMFFNVNQNINEYQHVQIAMAIIDRYGTDNIEDIVMALKNARSGMYGKIYGRIDGGVVLGWIQQYMEIKAEEMEKLHHQQKIEATTIAPGIATTIKQAMQQREYRQAQGTGVIHIDNGNTVDHATWVRWFEANKQNLGKLVLKSIRQQLKANNLYGNYTKTINWINERIEELSSIHVPGTGL